MRRLLRLLGLYRPFVGWMLLGVVLSLATLLANMTLMAVSGWFITSMALAGAAQVSMNYFTPAAIIRAAAIVRTGGRYAERLVTHEATLRLLAVLRQWFYARLEPLPPVVLRRYHGGDLLSRLRADVDTLDNLYLRLLVPAATAVLAVVLVTLFVAAYDRRMALSLLVLLALAGAVLPLVILRLGTRPGARRVASMSRLRAALVDDLQGLPERLVYGGGRDSLAAIAREDAELVHAQAALNRVEGLSQAGVLIAANLAVCTVLWLAIPQVESGLLAKPDMAMLVLLALAAFEAVVPMLPAFQAFGETRAAARRLFEIADHPLTTAQRTQGLDLPPPTSELVIDGLVFGYPGRPDPVLTGLDLRVPAGGRVTITGRSGAGKSTLLDLLLGFLQPDSGDISVGGMPLDRLNAEVRRRCFAVVAQQTHLFTATVADNLRLAAPDADVAELERVCRAAGVHDDIVAMPDGYDTWLGEAGTTLSGGQARRLVIARALLRDAPVVLLDEPTEGLDATTARALMDTLDRLLRGRAVVLITHRPPRDGRFGTVLQLVDGRLRTAGGQSV